MRGAYILRFRKCLVKFSVFGPHPTPAPMGVKFVVEVFDRLIRAKFHPRRAACRPKPQNRP